MANVDAPRGLWAINKNAPTNKYSVDSSNGTAIFQGDLVMLESDGNIAPATAGAGTSVIGVAVGLQDSDGKALSYLPASTAGYAIVADDPNTRFGIQADSGTSVTSADIGATADHVAGVGSTTTGQSAHELDSDDIGTGGQLRIMGKVNTPNNSWGEHVDLEVLINEHALKSTSSI